MERLTEFYRNSDGTGISKKSLVIEEGLKKGMPSGYCGAIVTKLADYEDAEEQGLLPKFHLGDEFWTEWLGKVLKAKVVMLQQKKNGTWKYRFCDELSNTYDYEENELGKYFWSTKEEAEQKLAEMKGV